MASAPSNPDEKRIDDFIWFYQNVEAIGSEHDGDLSPLNKQYGVLPEATDVFSTELARRLLPTFHSELERAEKQFGKVGTKDLLLVLGFGAGFRMGEMLGRMSAASDGKDEASEPSQND